MAIWYIDSAAVGANDGTSWTDAFDDFKTGIEHASTAAGDTFYVASGSSDVVSGVDYTVTSKGLVSNPVTIISVDKSDNSYLAGGKLSHTSGLSDDLYLKGTALCFGLTIDSADDFYNFGWSFTDSALTCGKHTSANGTFCHGGDAERWPTRYLNCTLSEGVSGSYGFSRINSSSNGGNDGQDCIVIVEGGSFSNFARLVRCDFTNSIHLTVIGCDLTGLSSSVVSDIGSSVLLFRDCKIGAGHAFASVTPVDGGSLTFESCDNGDVGQYYKHQDRTGISEYDTAKSRSATDGATAFSTEVVTSSRASRTQPFHFKLATAYVDTANFTSTVTFTIHVAREDVATLFTNLETWIDVKYKDGDINALTVSKTTGPADVLTSSSTNLTSASGNWTGLGGTNQEMTIAKTITIGAAAGNIASGVVEVWLNVAKASQTLYACPRVDLT